MALGDWQLALGQLVAARAAGRDAAVSNVLAGLDLDDAERAWLAGVPDTRGFGLTGFVPRWWRETRVRRAARLTFAALGEHAAAHLRDYLRSVPSFTLFFVPEGLAFIDYIDAAPAVSDLVHSVARFERAMWNVRLAGSAMSAPIAMAPNDGPLARHAAAAIIRFDAEPELVLAAALQGAPLPEPAPAPHHVLVAPGVRGRWRSATAAEALAFAACEPARTADALHSLPGVTPALVAALWSEQVLVSVRSAPPME